MTDRYRQMSDEEIEHLLQTTQRRMPSAALWERLAAEADLRTVRHAFPWRAAAAAAVAVLAVMVGVALLTSGRPSRPQVSERPSSTTSQVAVTPPPLAAPPVTQPANAAPAVAKIAEPQPMQQPLITRQAKRESRAPKAEPPDVGNPPEEPQISAPAAAEQTVVATMPSDAHEEMPESSYYIQVSRGGSSSVLEGSVTHSSSGDPKEIQIAYDIKTPRTNGAN